MINDERNDVSLLYILFLKLFVIVNFKEIAIPIRHVFYSLQYVF